MDVALIVTPNAGKPGPKLYEQSICCTNQNLATGTLGTPRISLQNSNTQLAAAKQLLCHLALGSECVGSPCLMVVWRYYSLPRGGQHGCNAKADHKVIEVMLIHRCAGYYAQASFYNRLTNVVLFESVI